MDNIFLEIGDERWEVLSLVKKLMFLSRHQHGTKKKIWIFFFNTKEQGVITLT